MENESELIIRPAVPEDAQEILEIYAPYVKNTAITFEYEVPSVREFRERIIGTLKKYPYLVAVREGRILGYAYAGTFYERAAYDWSVETTIYVRQDMQHCGIGGKLYGALEEYLRKMGILNLNACIAYPEEEDEYLTRNSPDFHEHFGYTLVGKFHYSGFKFGRWYSMIWMEKMIGGHTGTPAPVKRFDEILQNSAADSAAD